ncbi:MAG: glucan biosynthesis protein [Polyangiales bacterium]
MTIKRFSHHDLGRGFISYWFNSRTAARALWIGAAILQLTACAIAPSAPSCQDPSRAQNPSAPHDARATEVATAFTAPPAYFDVLVRAAQARAAAPHRPLPSLNDDGALARLSYDEHRQIRFRPAASLFREGAGAFEAQFFHLGGTSRTPVTLFRLERGEPTVIPYDRSFFTRGDGELPVELAASAYAGFRLHGPINGSGYRDEVIVFQGASYFRSLGPGQAYGLSARGLAIDTGTPRPEEFPVFDAFYLLPPLPGEHTAWVLASLTSPRAEGAFAFHVTLGDATIVDVTARVFPRGEIEALGIAPLTSMFLFGEESLGRGGDFRPEVHDSDVLVSVGRGGEHLARPLRNPAQTSVSSLRLDSPRGFGLLQRDRDFDNYQDLEAHYHARPSAWVEPLDDWGPGALRLLEIATELETDDNIVAMWVPDTVPDDGLALRYRMAFGDAVGPTAASHVVSTRVEPRATGQVRFLVDFVGPGLVDTSNVELVLTSGAATILEAHVEPNPHTGGVRASFVLEATRPAELRAFLRRGDHTVSETWSYPWRPTP